MAKMQFAGLAVAAALAAGAVPAHATIATVFNGIPQGTAAFNTTVTNAGGTPTADNWNPLGSGVSIDRGAYTITRNDGGSIFAGTYGSMTGQVANINPSGSGPGIGAIGSGLTLTFDDPINSIGFEVGDWGTCCQPSALFISFDDGAPIQVGVSVTGGDVVFNGAYEVFVAAFDDSGDFTKIQFWGDGFGEFLVMGGTVRYALIDEGSLPGVPAPAALGLFGFALAGLLAARRRKA